MRKCIKIFLFMFLLTITVMTTSCGIKNISETTNEGEIVVENNSNYESITVCGVVNGDDILGGMGDMSEYTNTNNDNPTTSSLKKEETPTDDPSENPDTSSMNLQLVGTVENCTNTGNLSVNNNTYELEETELLIEISGIVNNCEEIKDCKNEGQFTTDGNASQYKVETYDITKEKE